MRTFTPHRRLPGQTRLGFSLVLIVGLVSSLVGLGARAMPGSGTLSPAAPTLSYTAGPFLVANPGAQAGGGPVCNGPETCDDYALTVAVPAGYDANHNIRIEIGWPVAGADFDVYILRGESVIATAASSSDPEVAIIPALAGEYIVRVVPFAPAGQSITGNINLTEVTQGPPPSAGIAPRYSVFNPPSGLGQSAGEPSIGANWRTDKVLFQAVLETLRVSFDDCASPAVAA